MAYRLKDREALPDGIKRIAIEQIDRALERLKLKTRNKDRAIHEGRVCFKKIRAVLRLVRTEIGDDLFTLENLEYRDMGRRLSAVRDTVVVAETLETVLQHSSRHLSGTDLKSLRKRLGLSRVEQHGDRNEVLVEVGDALRSARGRVESWPLEANNFSVPGAGLRRVYKQGLRSFELARRNPGTEHFHQWRKQVKYLLYEISILNPLWPKMLDVLTRELNRLSDYLSEDHDLALLRERALEQTKAPGDLTEIGSLVRLIDHRRVRLQTRAISLGGRLYSEKPGAFVGRLQSYWEVWYSTTTVEPNEAVPANTASYQASASIS